MFLSCYTMYKIIFKSAHTKISTPARDARVHIIWESTGNQKGCQENFGHAILSLLMLFFVFSAILGAKSTACTQRTVDNHCCRFPFYYKGIRYRSCTYHGDVNNQFWCATEDFKYSRNVTTSWGYCKCKQL